MSIWDMFRLFMKAAGSHGCYSETYLPVGWGWPEKPVRVWFTTRPSGLRIPLYTETLERP